jgi:GTPase SAR1 family protein
MICPWAFFASVFIQFAPRRRIHYTTALCFLIMKTHTFEIKVALLGHVSAGKSTVLNALLRDKFSEVSMRRTTAGVNFFRLHTKIPKDANVLDQAEGDSNVKEDPEKVDTPPTDVGSWGSEPEVLRDASHTLQTIAHDNSILRQTNQIQECTFDVELDEPLCPMLSNTKLVLIDIPGLNEAGSKAIYLKYVNDKWNTFDCVIAVMDVMQGVNTEEQVQLLRMIQRNLSTKKKMPIIVLCNKVDDPDNHEIKILVNEVRTKVKEIFVPPSNDFAFGNTAVPSSNGRFSFGANAPSTFSFGNVSVPAVGFAFAEQAPQFSFGSTSSSVHSASVTPFTGFSFGTSQDGAISNEAAAGMTAPSDASSVGQSESRQVDQPSDESTFGGVGTLFKCIISSSLI